MPRARPLIRAVLGPGANDGNAPVRRPRRHSPRAQIRGAVGGFSEERLHTRSGSQARARSRAAARCPAQNAGSSHRRSIANTHPSTSSAVGASVNRSGRGSVFGAAGLFARVGIGSNWHRGHFSTFHSARNHSERPLPPYTCIEKIGHKYWKGNRLRQSTRAVMGSTPLARGAAIVESGAIRG